MSDNVRCVLGRDGRCLTHLRTQPPIRDPFACLCIVAAVELEAELELLRRLEAHLSDRRAMEPRHSREDHECPECETLAELAVLRRSAEKVIKG